MDVVDDRLRIGRISGIKLNYDRSHKSAAAAAAAVAAAAAATAAAAAAAAATAAAAAGAAAATVTSVTDDRVVRPYQLLIRFIRSQIRMLL